ncbi:MAG TPA: lipase maturation factor family protein, partial [Bdellovibrionales bacterium]|nr:lipase maturation factor family protein [Bdellovibrionales bacterium]
EPFLARWLEPLHSRLEVAPPPAWHAYLSLPFGILVGTLGLAWLLSALFPSLQLRKGLHALMSPFAGFHISNPYGLFAVMTTERPEIIIEGSEDGRNWKAYEFKYKPGRLDRAPPFVAPHQPRLDWQMWFAALGSYENNRWIQNLLVRLLKNEKSVIALLAENPFSEKPPRMIRASLYKYNFAASGSGDWWVREPRGDYSPTLERTGDD